MLSQYRIFAGQDCSDVIARYNSVRAIMLDLAKNRGNIVDIPPQRPPAPPEPVVVPGEEKKEREEKKEIDLTDYYDGSVCRRVFDKTLRGAVDYDHNRMLIVQRGSIATVCLLLTTAEYEDVIDFIRPPSVEIINIVNVVKMKGLERLGYNLSGQSVWPMSVKCNMSNPEPTENYWIQGDQPNRWDRIGSELMIQMIRWTDSYGFRQEGYEFQTDRGTLF